MILFLKSYFNNLLYRENKLLTEDDKTYIIDIMSQLDQKYVRGNNHIYWLQLFLNANWLENELVSLNKNLSFIEENHNIIDTNIKRGNCIPEFNFLTESGKNITIDSKTFFNIENFKNTNNFEHADYCLAFIMSENKFYIRHKINGSYTDPIAFEKLQVIPNNELNTLVLPKEIKMISFINVNSVLKDNEIKCPINYDIHEYKVLN